MVNVGCGLVELRRRIAQCGGTSTVLDMHKRERASSAPAVSSLLDFILC